MQWRLCRESDTYWRISTFVLLNCPRYPSWELFAPIRVISISDELRTATLQEKMGKGRGNPNPKKPSWREREDTILHHRGGKEGWLFCGWLDTWRNWPAACSAQMHERDRQPVCFSSVSVSVNWCLKMTSNYQVETCRSRSPRRSRCASCLLRFFLRIVR